jgi:hypothetical protein
MNVKEFRLKIHLMKFYILNFDLGPLKMNIYCIRRTQFCKDYENDSYNIKKLMGKKLKG